MDRSTPAVAASEPGIRFGQSFGGLHTEEVRTGIADSEVALRRVAIDDRHALQTAINAEWELFELLSRRAGRGVRCLRPLGWSRRPNGFRAALYEFVTAIPPSESSTFRELIGHRVSWRLHTLAGIAKCMRKVHEAGHVLGTIDSHMFLYAVELTGPRLLPVARPLLAYAPGTVRMGAPHAAAVRLDAGDVVYPRLNLSRFVPQVAGRTEAHPEHDALAFGACALEMLAKRPLGEGALSYTDIPHVVRDKQNWFEDGRLAARIAEAMSGQGTVALTKLVDALCVGLKPTPDDWLALFMSM